MKAFKKLKYMNKQFDLYQDEIMKGNRVMIKITSISACAIFAALTVAAFFVKSIENSQLLYAIFAGYSLLFAILNRVLKSTVRCTRILMNAVSAGFMSFSIVLGTFLSPTITAATFLILLILLPILFVENPIITILTNAIYLIFFFICAIIYKDPNIIIIDLINAFTAFAISLVAFIIMSRLKFSDLKLQEELRTLSNEDELTKLYNRRYINKFFNDINDMFQIENEELCVLMIDIDNFKNYNDINGHLIGDNCIVKVANIVKEVSEKYSAIGCRFGGEEFLVVLNQVEISDLDKIAQEILQGVRDLDLKHDSIFGIITVSVGISSKKMIDAKNYIELINSADMALYRAKNAGKNTIVRASD